MFYLMVSAGGALGGLFGLLAPYVFRGFYELPVALGRARSSFCSCCRKPRRSALGLGRAAILLAEGLTVLLLVLLFQVVRLQSRQAQVTVRNFYGVLRVSIVPPGRVRPSVTHLRNGTVVHGEEILDTARNDVPTTYYGQQSGVGIPPCCNIRVGTPKKGDHYFFYEINPLVVDVANKLFDFLGQSEAQVEIIPGDGRLSLENKLRRISTCWLWILFQATRSRCTC